VKVSDRGASQRTC